MKLVTVEDKNVWDKFIESSPYGMLFHKWDFLRIIEKHTGYKLHPLAVYRSEEIICAIPIFHKKIMGINMVFSPPPQTGIPYMGFVMTPLYDSLKQRKKESFLNSSVDLIETEINNLSSNYTALTTVPGFVDVRPYEWKNYNINADYTYILNLEKPLDDIFESFDRNCKNKIKHGLSGIFTFSQSHDLDSFYKIMQDRYREQGRNYPIVNVDYLKDLLNTFPENIKLYFVYNGDEIVGIELSCIYKDQFLDWMGGANLKKELPTNEYATWELIKIAKNDGYKYFDMAGANTSRLCEFKSKFNPMLKQYYTINKKNAMGMTAEWGYTNIIKKNTFRIKP